MKPLLGLLGVNSSVSNMASLSSSDSTISAQTRKDSTEPSISAVAQSENVMSANELPVAIQILRDTIEQRESLYERILEDTRKDINKLYEVLNKLEQKGKVDRLLKKLDEMSKHNKQIKQMDEMNERIEKLLEKEKRSTLVFVICTFLATFLIVLVLNEIIQ